MLVLIVCGMGKSPYRGCWIETGTMNI